VRSCRSRKHDDDAEAPVILAIGRITIHDTDFDAITECFDPLEVLKHFFGRFQFRRLIEVLGDIKVIQTPLFCLGGLLAFAAVG
jgi:hypothetical protein